MAENNFCNFEGDRRPTLSRAAVMPSLYTLGLSSQMLVPTSVTSVSINMIFFVWCACDVTKMLWLKCQCCFI